MNIRSIVQEIKSENDKERRRIDLRIKQAHNEVERLKKDFLKIDEKMGKMVLFGSLAESNIDSINFDIDIAVKSKKYYRLVGRALESQFKIDVIDLDTIHENIRKVINEHGKVIYEKK